MRASTRRCPTWWARRRAGSRGWRPSSRALPWQQARPGVDVKLLPPQGRGVCLAQSHARVHKERAMRRRQLKGLWKRLHQLQQMPLTRGCAPLEAGGGQAANPRRLAAGGHPAAHGHRAAAVHPPQGRLRAARRREGRYLLRTNLTDTDRRPLGFYMQLVRVEEAFRTLKGDLALRPDLPPERRAHRGAHFLASWRIVSR